MTRPDPPGIHHTTSGHGAASPGASTVVSHCLGHHPVLHMCTFPFCLYFSTFSLLKGKKPNRCLENCGMLLLSSGCSLAMAPVAWGTACLLLPRCGRIWGTSTSSGCKEKKSRLCSPPFLHLYLRLGNLPTPRRDKPPSCQCRTGNTSPVQRQAADTENVLKPPLLLPKTFKLFRALRPTPSKNTNTA